MMAIAVGECFAHLLKIGDLIAGLAMARMVSRIISVRMISRRMFLSLILLFCLCWLALICLMVLKMTCRGFFATKRYIRMGTVAARVKNRIEVLRNDSWNIRGL
jgi:hypothetical protein